VVHKKYTRRNGKLYGPYLYENKRVNGKVVTSYVGKGDVGEIKESKVKSPVNPPWIFLGIIFCVMLALLFIGQGDLTGRISTEIQTTYNEGELLDGTLVFNLEEKEFIPANSKVIARLGDEIRELVLSDLVEEDAVQGTFYASGVNISGSGLGYGGVGEKVIYPTVTFKLEIFYLDADEIGEEISSGGGGDSGGDIKEIVNETSEETSEEAVESALNSILFNQIRQN